MKTLMWMMTASLCFGFTTSTSTAAAVETDRTTDAVLSDGEATGACCDANNICLILTRQECIDNGSDYQGDDVACYSSPCRPTATLDLSWGQIKELYR